MNKILIFCILISFSIPFPCLAEGILTYKPPKTGAPATRVGGGTRGVNLEEAKLEVMAPSQTALTQQAQPILYWYLSKPHQQAVEITLIQEGVELPLLETRLPLIENAGLQRIALTEYGVRLQAGEEYRWFVAIINDPEQRSRDSISSATIRYETVAQPLSSVEQMAAAGYWYDALQTLIEQDSPKVNQLLQQIGLGDLKL